MKTFTVKDFIRYNNPCFNCNNKISFTFKSSTTSGLIPTVMLRTNVVAASSSVDVELQIVYARTLNLKINLISNKVISPTLPVLTEYLESHKLFLSSTCNSCYTFIESGQLDFNLQKGFAKPVTLSKEILMIKDDENLYQINSSFVNNRSQLVIDKLNKISSFSAIDLPLIPLYKLKNKETCLKKIKTYILFS